MSFPRRQRPERITKPMPSCVVDAFGRLVERSAGQTSDVVQGPPSQKLVKVSPHARKATTSSTSRPVKPVLKTSYELPVKEDQKRLWGYVSQLPCMYPDCGVLGVQVAHLSLLEFGKGRGLKVPPAYVAALCPLHHTSIDSGKNMMKPDRRDALLYAGYRTMCELISRGWIRPV